MSSSSAVNRSYVGPTQEDVAPYRAEAGIRLSSLRTPKADEDDTTPNEPEIYLSKFMVKRSWWLFELSASVLSITGLGALVAVLLYHDGKPDSMDSTSLHAQRIGRGFSYCDSSGAYGACCGSFEPGEMELVLSAKSTKRTQVTRQGTEVSGCFRRSIEGSFGEPEASVADKRAVSLKSLSTWRFPLLCANLDRLHRPKTSIGALVTILSLAFNALSQQLLAVENRDINSSSGNLTSGVQRSECYDVHHAKIASFYGKSI